MLWVKLEFWILVTQGSPEAQLTSSLAHQIAILEFILFYTE